MTLSLAQQNCLNIIQGLNNTHFQSRPFHPAGIMAFIEIESDFDSDVTRFEPTLNESSYGLMQILESTAKGIGFSVDALLNPGSNIFAGMTQILWIEHYFTEHNFAYSDMHVVCAFNEGVGNVMKGRPDLAYWDEWQAAEAKWEGLLA